MLLLVYGVFDAWPFSVLSFTTCHGPCSYPDFLGISLTGQLSQAVLGPGTVCLSLPASSYSPFRTRLKCPLQNPQTRPAPSVMLMAPCNFPWWHLSILNDGVSWLFDSYLCLSLLPTPQYIPSAWQTVLIQQKCGQQTGRPSSLWCLFSVGWKLREVPAGSPHLSILCCLLFLLP